MTLARVKSWTSEVLTATDLNAEFNNILNFVNASKIQAVDSLTLATNDFLQYSGTAWANKTPAQVLAALVGTSTNDSATAGNIGEFFTGTVTTGSPLSVSSSGAAQDLITLSLTAGDWDVEGSLQTIPAGGTTTSLIIGGLSSTLNTLPSGELRSILNVPVAAGLSTTVALPRQRFSLSGAATIRLVANITFAVSTMQMCGFINARRAR